MKTLKDILNESLLDDADDILNHSVKELIIKFLKDNYYIKDYNISDEPDDGGKYVVNCDQVEVKNKRIGSLTNRFFKFGIVKDFFNCSYCTSLKTLEGAPKEVGGNFGCVGCDSLKTLEGAPKEVGGNFKCSYCASLKNLEGAPKEVGGDFNCFSCTSLKSLEGTPKEVGGDFYCDRCSKTFDIEDIKKYSNIKGIITV